MLLQVNNKYHSLSSAMAKRQDNKSSNLSQSSYSITYAIASKVLPEGSVLTVYQSPETTTTPVRITYLDGMIILKMISDEWICMTSSITAIKSPYYWVCAKNKLLANHDFTIVLKMEVKIPQGILFKKLTLDIIYSDLLKNFERKKQMQMVYRDICGRYGEVIGNKWKVDCINLLFEPHNPLPRGDAYISSVPITGLEPFNLDRISPEIIVHILNLVMSSIYQVNPRKYGIIFKLRCVCTSFNALVQTVRCKSCVKMLPKQHPNGKCDECKADDKLEKRNGVCMRCTSTLTDRDKMDTCEWGFCKECSLERMTIFAHAEATMYNSYYDDDNDDSDMY